MADDLTTVLNEALRNLNEGRILPAAVGYLTDRCDAIEAELNKTVLAEIPAFSESRNPEILADLARQCRQHTDEIIRLLGGGSVGDFEFVRDHARRRAEQRFPLETTLHAYRCGHKVFARWVREATQASGSSSPDLQQAITAVADFAMEYTDTISTIATSVYVSHTRFLADVAGDQRANLLTVLLDGHDESDGRVAKILRDAGYLDRRLSFCVVLARSVDPAEMQNPARARRMADAMEKALQGSAARSLIDIRDDKVTIVCSDTARTSGWTVPRIDLAKRLSSAFAPVGPAALIGVSNDAPSTSHIPTAYREAQLALQLADVTRRVTQFSEIPVQQLILHMAGEEFQRVLPPWAADFIRADAKSRGTLDATLRAYAGADMNVLKSAKTLKVHPNTIYARFERILDMTGLDARSYHALTELLLIADCARLPNAGAPRTGRDAT